ncbi:MAG: hypothetical protein IJZ26_03460 [Clostridia bacterium]|nr:hypothetical protein [Clostridia bacterium]
MNTKDINKYNLKTNVPWNPTISFYFNDFYSFNYCCERLTKNKPSLVSVKHHFKESKNVVFLPENNIKIDNSCYGNYVLQEDCFNEFDNATIVFTSKNSAFIEKRCFKPNAEINFILPKNHKLYLVTEFETDDKVNSWLLVADKNDIQKDVKNTPKNCMLQETTTFKFNGNINVDTQKYYDTETNTVKDVVKTDTKSEQFYM